MIDNNSPPRVSDLFLETPISSRDISGILSISDTDLGQTHYSEILNLSERGMASLTLDQFNYSGFPGFRGLDDFYILTYDNGNPVKAVVSKVSVNVNFNTSPQLLANSFFTVPKGASNFAFKLNPGIDFENDDLTYSLVTPPDHGILSGCLEGSNKTICKYTPPEGFVGAVTFSYRASDSLALSDLSLVTLRVISFSGTITQVALGYNNSCVVFDEGHIRCWGSNYSGQLGLGHTRPIGDDEKPLYQGDIDVGEGF